APPRRCLRDLDAAQLEQLVETPVEPRRRRHGADREQYSGYVRLAARGAVGDGEGLARQAEDDLLVGDEARQPDAVYRDLALLPASRARERLLLRLLVTEWPVPALGSQPPRGRERSSGRRVELGGVVHLDHLHGVKQRRRDLGE